MEGLTVLWFDIFYVIAGSFFAGLFFSVGVAVFWKAYRDPETERIAEARGDYRIGGGNHG